MEKKVTKRENYLKVLDYVKDNADLVAFINHEIELLDKKNLKVKKPTARQIENENLKDVILDIMVAGTQYTIADLQSMSPSLAELSNQRISAILSQLVEDKAVERIIKSRKSYFSKY